MENKEEFANKHLEGFIKEWETNTKSVWETLKDYQKKHNLIPSMEVWKWYKDSISNICGFITKINNNKAIFYGFDFYEVWTKEDWFDIRYGDINMIEIPAEEWQSMLLEKAKKDYPKGTKISMAYEWILGELDRFEYEDGEIKRWSKGDCLIKAGGEKNYTGYTIIYKDGVWAEIIQEEEPKIEETETHTIITIPKGVEFKFKVK